jgi:hypothetical protein
VIGRCRSCGRTERALRSLEDRTDRGFPQRPHVSTTVRSRVPSVEEGIVFQTAAVSRSRRPQAAAAGVAYGGEYDSAVASHGCDAGGADRRGSRTAASPVSRAGGLGSADSSQRESDRRRDPRRASLLDAPDAIGLPGSLHLYRDRVRIFAGRLQALHARQFQPGEGSIRPEHRAQRVAAVSGNRRGFRAGRKPCFQRRGRQERTLDRTDPINAAGPLHTLLEGTFIDAVLTTRALQRRSTSTRTPLMLAPESHRGARA